MLTWIYSYFPWMVSSEPPPPDNSALEAILTGIGVTGAPLTVTLLWTGEVDLDLYMYCPNTGTGIGYDFGVNVMNPDCNGKLDWDHVEDAYGFVRGDGSTGQIENISINDVSEGTTFNGVVNYYGYSNAPQSFQVVFSGTDFDGHLHVYG